MQPVTSLCMYAFLTAVVLGVGTSDSAELPSNSVAAGSSSRSRKLMINGQRSTYTINRMSMRNYNTGARYYMRFLPSKTTMTTFGYSFYRVGQYYHSGYGYQLYHPPTFYTPVYLDPDYVYYPPMFLYYYQKRPRYFSNGRPNYLCRNDFAFWPLESERSAFVNGRPPSVKVTDFDQYLPDPPEDDSYSYTYSLNSWRAPRDSDLTEVTSLFWSDDHDERPQKWIDKSDSPANLSGKKVAIRTYRFFACPDGKDPDEVYCCGVSSAQYCCVYDDYTDYNPKIGKAVFFAVVVCGSMALFVGLVTKSTRSRILACLEVRNSQVVSGTTQSVNNSVTMATATSTRSSISRGRYQPVPWTSVRGSPRSLPVLEIPLNTPGHSHSSEIARDSSNSLECSGLRSPPPYESLSINQPFEHSVALNDETMTNPPAYSDCCQTPE